MALVAPGEPADLRPPPRPVGEALQEQFAAFSQQVAAGVQNLHSALQAALDEAAAARSQDRSQLEEERARTQQVTSVMQHLENDISVLRSEQFRAQQVEEALQELQSKFDAFTQQEKEARSVQEGELQKLRSDLGEERAKAEREEETRSVQEEELQKLRADLGEEKAKSERVAADVRALQSENAVLTGQLQQEKEARWAQEKDVRKLYSDLGEEKAKAERVAVDVQGLRSALQMALGVVAELQTVRQELQDRCKALEEVQRSDQEVTERLAGKVLVPEFCPNATVTELQYSHGDRRCRYTGKCDERIAAVAKEGFTSGRQQFTVLVDTEWLFIGVNVANAPRTGFEAHRQGVFLKSDGKVYTLDGHQRSYTTAAKSFKAGSRVTMRLDFGKGTASFEVDGVDLGVVGGLTLPEGPLYPAVVFIGAANHEDVVEFVPYAPALPASVAARA